MKNEKEFDYDKKKPNFEKIKQKKINDAKDKKLNESSSFFEKSPIIKNIEVTQGEPFNKEIFGKNQIFDNQNSEKINHNEISKKEEINIPIISLPEKEIIEPNIPLLEDKKPNQYITKNIIENKIKSTTDILLKDSIETSSKDNNKKDNTIHQEIQENKILDSNISLNMNNQNKKNISFNRNKSDYETLIKIQKINDLNQRKKNIEKKINKAEENIKNYKDENLFNQNNKLNIPNIVIEQNIKNEQLKENKQIKEYLLSKLNCINEQVNKLMENEKELNSNKRLNVKEFLDNFEKDKLKYEEQARKYSEEKKLREQRILKTMLKDEKREKELDNLKIKENEIKKKELEKIRMNELERLREKKREKKEKIDHIREHVNDKPESEDKYLFRILERKYNEKMEQEAKKEIMKKRERIKGDTISLVEILEFDKKQKEIELKRIVEMEEEKRKLKEKWKQTKENLPKFESSLTQKLKEEENQKKEKYELEQFKKQSKIKEIKNYSQTVQKLFLPKINENIKKERENRIKNLKVKDNIQKIHRKKNNGRILLVKPDPCKPKKYTWKLKLEPCKNDDNSLNNSKIENINLRSRSADKKHKPMKKLPDYLTEMRLEKDRDKNNNVSQRKHKEYNWDKMIKKGNFVENIEKIKLKAQELENQVKMNNQLLNNSRNDDIELQQKVSNCLIDAINAKLSILDNIGK